MGVVVDIQEKLRLALASMKDHASIGKAMLMFHHHHHYHIEIAVLRATCHHPHITSTTSATTTTAVDDNKHIHEILFLVSHSGPDSVPFLAEQLSRRLHKTHHRFVSLKTLLLLHRLLRGGNRRFEHDLCHAHLISGHLQLTLSHHVSGDPFLHNYASYLRERMTWAINQAGKLEPNDVVSKGLLEFRRYDERFIDMAFRTLPKCQVLIDRVLDLDCCCSVSVGGNCCDVLAQAAMVNTLKESFQVYATFKEGVGVLVNMLFDLTESARGLACEILKKASDQSQRLHEMYQNCKKVVENKNLEYPCVEIISMDHIIMALDAQTLGVSETEHGKKKKKKEERNLTQTTTTTLFSWTVLETKISNVWVVFEDETAVLNPFSC